LRHSGITKSSSSSGRVAHRDRLLKQSSSDARLRRHNTPRTFSPNESSRPCRMPSSMVHRNSRQDLHHRPLASEMSRHSRIPNLLHMAPLSPPPPPSLQSFSQMLRLPRRDFSGPVDIDSYRRTLPRKRSPERYGYGPMRVPEQRLNHKDMPPWDRRYPRGRF
jgi:hypothetical protein